MQNEAAAAPRRIRVLLIDDSDVFLKTASRYLSRVQEVELVGMAKNGYEGLESVRAVRPDVALVDLNMPGMSGHDVIRRLRSDFPEVKAIVLTLHAGEDHQAEARAAGAHGFVSKANMITELIPTIHQALST